jgi:hypothetical protein
MQNLSFLKGLAVGLAIATVGSVVYASTMSSVDNDVHSGSGVWLQKASGSIYYCWTLPQQSFVLADPQPMCRLAINKPNVKGNT